MIHSLDPALLGQVKALIWFVTNALGAALGAVFKHKEVKKTSEVSALQKQLADMQVEHDRLALKVEIARYALIEKHIQLVNVTATAHKLYDELHSYDASATTLVVLPAVVDTKTLTELLQELQDTETLLMEKGEEDDHSHTDG